MAHYAYDPTPSAGIPDSSVLGTIAADELGGTFTSVPAAVFSFAQPPIVATEPAAGGGAGTLPGTGEPPPGTGPGKPIHLTSPPAAIAPEDAPGAAPHPVHLPVPTEPRIDVFALDAGYAMRHLQLWNGKAPSPQPQWTDLGGIFISTPAAVAWEDRVDVFGVGLDRAMYRKTLRLIHGHDHQAALATTSLVRS